MALTFDHTNKLIGVPQADAAPLLIQSLLNAIRDEEASERGIAYDPIVEASGKADLGGGVMTGITLALQSTWKLNFASGAYQALVDGGNLAEGLSRVNNSGSPQVLLRMSAAATMVTVSSGSGLSPAQDAALAAIKAKTDAMSITDGNVHADVKKMNGATVAGTGASGDKWRGA